MQAFIRSSNLLIGTPNLLSNNEILNKGLASLLTRGFILNPIIPLNDGGYLSNSSIELASVSYTHLTLPTKRIV